MYKVFIVILLSLYLVSCGKKKAHHEPEEGLEAALKCTDDALPNYEIRSVSVSATTDEIQIRLVPIN